jgi:hypothetical protein
MVVKLAVGNSVRNCISPTDMVCLMHCYAVVTVNLNIDAIGQ